MICKYNFVFARLLLGLGLIFSLRASADNSLSITCLGDISFSRGIAKIISTQQNPNFPFAKIQSKLINSDFVFANLESPITSGRVIQNKEMIFRADPGIEKALQKANVSIVNLANNHITNFGNKGILDTLNYLQTVNINYSGVSTTNAAAYQPCYLQKNGTTVAFLSYADKYFVPSYFSEKFNNVCVAIADLAKMQQAVRNAKQKADVVIVSLHAGDEYQNYPNEMQIKFAHAAIDAGADLVIGHHPHVIQSLEKYKGKYIFYSLGNFIFDQKFNNEVREALLLQLHINKKYIANIDIDPIFINDQYQPEVGNAATAKVAIAKLNYKAIMQKPIITWDPKSKSYIAKTHYFVAGTFINEQNPDQNIKIRGHVLSLRLMHNQLSLLKDSAVIWQTPITQKVVMAQFADVTNSANSTINYSLWKSKKYGRDKPFWKKDSAQQTPRNHFFIYKYNADKVIPVWGSSDLDAPNCKFAIADVNNDGKNELITLEGDYANYPECSGKYLGIWVWNGWGFTNLWRSPKGDFKDFRIESSGSTIVVY